MFFLLSKLLDLLLAPLTWAFLLLGAALLWRRRAAPWLVGAAVAVLYLFSVEPVADGLSRLAEAGVRSTMRPDVTYDAAIVLGGCVDPAASRVSGQTELLAAGERAVAGYELFHSGRVRNLLLSAGGTSPEEDPVEADYLSALYRRLGVPADRIVLERESRNTRENAEQSARLVRERGWKTLLLVTSAAHMPRAAATFRKSGLDVDLYPVDHRYGDRTWVLLPRSDAFDRSTAALRELAGRLVYRGAGYTGS